MKSFETREKLIAALSHDLRNPLGAILAYAEMLSDAEDLSPRHARQIDSIQRAAKRMNAMIQNIVDLTKLEQQALDFDRAEHACDSLLQALPELVDPMLKRRTVKLSLAPLPEDEALKFIGDRNRALQILEILAQNAIQLSPENATVTVAISATSDTISITVKDSGPGMSEKELESYFGANSGDTARPARGLSLHLARLLAERLDGTLTAKSGLGHGTEATLSLPRARHIAAGMTAVNFPGDEAQRV